ncbi:hypothetical protein BJY04DRAFT_192542 [Aspergillus karnatakaensis]|uniref:uncharacterized protein n=1 Tax=Aspergillus karnatakaensis TaxID=1810916 RepID=UPI003CCD14A9
MRAKDFSSIMNRLPYHSSTLDIARLEVRKVFPLLLVLHLINTCLFTVLTNYYYTIIVLESHYYSPQD